MNDGIYDGTQSEGSESVNASSGSITVPGSATTGDQYDVFISVTGADVFETDTTNGAGGAKTADGSAYVSIGRYLGAAEISLRCGSGDSSTVAWTAKKIVG
tara:strand:- start:217 stop:519 length:303 start_codon:yes stop_codon:yes gene_type:complete